jgi:hypothetical protein
LGDIHLLLVSTALFGKTTLTPTRLKEDGMKRKASYRLMVTRREMLYVHDEFDHALMLVEMEGEPLEYQIGIAGAFVSQPMRVWVDEAGHTDCVEVASEPLKKVEEEIRTLLTSVQQKS